MLKPPFEPKVFIPQLYPRIDMFTLQAKRLTALQWKTLSTATIGRWLREKAVNMSTEKLTYIVKFNYALLDEIWKPFISNPKRGDSGTLLEPEDDS